MPVSKKMINNLEVLLVENDQLSVQIVPALGGKVISVFNKRLGKEFVWTNQRLRLRANKPYDEYDPNFTGGIDELLPNDLPEIIDGIDYPDHGELWTTPLSYSLEGDRVHLSAELPLSKLFYSRTVQLDPVQPIIHLTYFLQNNAVEPRHFLWKFHAAAKINEGDQLISTAGLGQVVDPAYSRFQQTEPFSWPMLNGTDVSIVPPVEGTMDFFYLFDIGSPRMLLESADHKTLFGYTYDAAVFPYQWYFASFGGFLDHYTAILEPCSAMPISVAEAMVKNQCSRLAPGENIKTEAQLFAGEKKQYLSYYE
ncbi:DUF5107 domain-containing protein [Flavihumibacter fluvii]|uniref:DUF5107 domain-containing protein n=1 Tax=Flavihumibacter fluvii TaxID=2838157 RepID=UPI001BDE85E4|nr:DUF5107 domain-containing protein [Flavihumibacter fluvii]ULQ52441.1 DUF5107 domain-containing protein [Flavihumibacter fluvii]